MRESQESCVRVRSAAWESGVLREMRVRSTAWESGVLREMRVRSAKCAESRECNDSIQGECNDSKSTLRICLIYSKMAPFIDIIKFHLWNLNINNLMLINFHTSLITKRIFWSFDRYSNKTVTLSELLQDMNNFSKTIVVVIRKSYEFSSKIVRVITIYSSRIPLIFLWMPANDVRALPEDTRWRHDFQPSCCWVHLPMFFSPWFHQW